MPHSDILHLRCPAKINLALSVAAPLATGPSQGLHPIASWIAALDLADDLTLARLPAPQAAGFSPGSASHPPFDIAFHSDAPRPQPIDWPLEKDLTFRAWQLLQQHVGHALPVRITLRKRIPAGGGLGGGSSNAAAMLVGLNQLFSLHLPTATLKTLAASLGSDVVFFVTALSEHSPQALVTGVGDQIQPLQTEGFSPGPPGSPNPKSQITNHQSPIPITLFFPPFGCPTGPVYRAFDALGPAPATPDERRVRDLLQLHPLPPHAPFNDLAQPACIVQPALGDLIGALAAALQWPIHVTGSGSTLFAVASGTDHAHDLARRAAGLAPALAAVTL
jgi:4-diphosphocytidyl-2-C-methyl-D-erythritol kinase